MSQLGKTLAGIPFKGLRNGIVRLLYKKNGIRLESIKKTKDGNFWIHHVNGIYFATEVLNWYKNYGSFESDCRHISLAFYQPAPGDTIIDLGAGLGEETIVYSKMVGSGGRIYAVEANSRICNVLNRVIELNNFSNTTVLNVAINDQSGFVEIEDLAGSYISGSIHTGEKIPTFSVEALGMDDFIEKYKIQKVDLLKVNIEGAEKFALQTLKKHFNKVKNFAISCHDFRYNRGESVFFKTRDEVISHFKNRGLVINQQHTGIDHIDDWIYVRV